MLPDDSGIADEMAELRTQFEAMTDDELRQHCFLLTKGIVLPPTRDKLIATALNDSREQLLKQITLRP